MALRRTYYISIDRQTEWSTTDDTIAAAQAKSIAQQYGGCEMIAINEAGGGHVTVYGPLGEVGEIKPLMEVDRWAGRYSASEHSEP